MSLSCGFAIISPLPNYLTSTACGHGCNLRLISAISLQSVTSQHQLKWFSDAVKSNVSLLREAETFCVSGQTLDEKQKLLKQLLSLLMPHTSGIIFNTLLH